MTDPHVRELRQIKVVLIAFLALLFGNTLGQWVDEWQDDGKSAIKITCDSPDRTSCVITDP